MTVMTEILKKHSPVNFWNNLTGTHEDEVYYVVHPLYDEPEEKCDPTTLGPMHLSKGERAALLVLRGYMFLMLALATYRVADLAGVFHHLAH